MGWGGTATHLLDRALSASSGGRARLRVYRLYSMPVPNAPLIPASFNSPWCIREIGPGDPLCDRLVRARSVIDARFARGSRCIVALRGDDVLGFVWLHVGTYQEDEVDCEFVPTPVGLACWDFDVFVHPAHRVGRLFVRLWDHALQIMRDGGLRASASRIAIDNPGSVRAHAAMGARPTATAMFLRLGDAQLTIANVAPWFRPSFGAWGRPTIEVPEASPARSERERVTRGG